MSVGMSVVRGPITTGSFPAIRSIPSRSNQPAPRSRASSRIRRRAYEPPNMTGYQGPTLGPLDVSGGSNSASGWLAGAQIGYNYQIKNWVLGVEGEVSWTSLKGSNKDPNYSNINQTDTDFVGVLSGRLGYAWDRLLVYGKAGGAWAHDKYSVLTNTTFTVGNGSPAPVTVTSGTMVDAATVNRFGYMLGAGVEYALTPQWSVRAEYQYLDFGWQHTTFTPTTTVVSPIDENIRQRIQVAEIGLNYRLDPTPASASSSPLYNIYNRAPKSKQRFYAGADYLLWWVKGAPLSVPLVSTGPSSNHWGIDNSNQTTILYGAGFAPAGGGNDTANFNPVSGGRCGSAIGSMMCSILRSKPAALGCRRRKPIIM